MSKPTDDLEAVRSVIEALQGFDVKEQQRIFRWAAEKLGLPEPFQAGAHPPIPADHMHQHPPAQHAPAPDRASGVQTQDIKSFVAVKNPRSDVQFAATVAYYFQFEAPAAEKKRAITKDDLQEACRKAGRERFVNPAQTLRNAHQLGLLDKGDEAGAFTINTVGENLVAMTLPGDGARKKQTTGPKKVSKKAAAKKAKKA